MIIAYPNCFCHGAGGGAVIGQFTLEGNVNFPYSDDFCGAAYSNGGAVVGSAGVTIFASTRVRYVP